MLDVNVIPKPVHVIQTEGRFELKSSTCIVISQEAISVGNYLKEILFKDTGYPLDIHNVESDQHQDYAIYLITGGVDRSLGKEGYELDVSSKEIWIRALTPAGLFYGVQTLRQLLIADGVFFPAVAIKDWPRFSWRGIMLDVGRHMFPIDFIKRLIDVMALHKLNTFHWHLTEDQGWRIEIKKYPRLTEIGSQRSASPIQTDREKLDNQPYGGFYTQEQILDIVGYATSRFITTVPEIEMPGHSIAALASYPELGCTGGPYTVRNFWGIEEDVFCAGNEQVFTFLRNVLDEVLSLFPSVFIHIGGDECPKTRWEQCPKCQKAIKKHGLLDEKELQSYFINQIEAYLRKKGRRLIGWDEILEGGLAPNASVMSWRGMMGGIQAAQGGNDVVMTPTSHCYFDYFQSADIASEYPAIGGYLPLETVYNFEPIPPEISDEGIKHILGGQGNLWTEYIPTPEQAEYMLFPRATALAEVVWSPVLERNFTEFQQRLQVFLQLLDKLSINYQK